MSNIELKARFVDLAGRLSPENLSCDGELSARQVAARRKAIMTEWAVCERAYGSKVTEDDAWDWFAEVRDHRRAEDQRAIAEEPSNPLLEHNSVGVWVRRGSNTMAAYYIQGPGLHRHAGEYRLYSEFSYMIRGAEHVGTFPEFDIAVNIGEAMLKAVTPAAVAAAHPQWSKETVLRNLKRLPQDYLSAVENLGFTTEQA